MALAGLAAGFVVVTLDVPIHFGWVFADYPDPDRPSHLKGAAVSGPELTLHVAIAVLCLWVAYRFWLRLPKEEVRAGSG